MAKAYVGTARLEPTGFRSPRSRRGRHVRKEGQRKRGTTRRSPRRSVHSADISYKPLSGEIGMCLRVGRMGPQVWMERDRTTRSGAKAPGVDWSGRAKARSGLRMIPTFPLPSLKFRTAGFPQYGFKAGRSDRAFPFYASSRRTVCHCPSCSPLPASDPRSVPGDVARWSTSVRAAAAARIVRLRENVA
jgi:hypothetical protein